MLLGVMVTVCLAAQGPTRTPVAVMVSSKRPGSAQLASAVATRVTDAIAAESKGLVLSDAEATRIAKRDARSCNAVGNCLLSIAGALGSRAVVVGVDVGKIRNSVGVYLEAFAADSGESLAMADFTLPLDEWKSGLSQPMGVFVKALIEKLGPPAAVVVETPAVPNNEPVDAPVAEPVPTPLLPTKTATADAPPVVERPTSTRAPRLSERARVQVGSSPVKWVMLGLTGAAAATGATFGVLAIDRRNFIEKSNYIGTDGMPRTRLSDEAYSTNARFANTSATVALFSLIGAGVLAIVTVVLFAVDG